MFTLIKLIQSLFGALHSEGTPGQLAAGIVLGSFLGLTPLVNLPQRPHFRGAGAAERLLRGRHAGLGALCPDRIPARPAVRLDRAQSAARAVVAGTLDVALQHADRPAEQLQ